MPPLPPSLNFDSPEMLGALEIGAFVSIFLFGTVVMQGHLYYQNCKNDPRWLISFVTLILLLELGHVAATAQTVWWATITIADLVIKPGNGYAIALCILYSAITTFFVKAYYINRVRLLSSKLLLAIIGWLLTCIDLGLSLAVSYQSFADVPREPESNFNLQREWGWLITTSMSVSAGMDVLIAVAMVWYLKRVEVGTMRHSAQLVNELAMWTIETGLLTSVASVAALVCFHTMEFNYIWFSVYLPLANLYSIAVLASLNARPARRQRLALAVNSSESPIRFASRSSSSSGTSVSRSSRRSSVEVTRSQSSGTSITWSSSSLSSRRSTIASCLEARARREAAESASGSSSLRRSTVAGSGVRAEKKSFDGGVRNTPNNKNNSTTHINCAPPSTTTSNQNQNCAYAYATATNDNWSSNSSTYGKGNGKKRTIGKEQYVYSGTVRPRATSRLGIPGHSRHPSIISPIQEGRMF